MQETVHRKYFLINNLCENRGCWCFTVASVSLHLRMPSYDEKRFSYNLTIIRYNNNFVPGTKMCPNDAYAAHSFGTELWWLFHLIWSILFTLIVLPSVHLRHVGGIFKNATIYYYIQGCFIFYDCTWQFVATSAHSPTMYITLTIPKLEETNNYRGCLTEETACGMNPK